MLKTGEKQANKQKPTKQNQTTNHQRNKQTNPPRKQEMNEKNQRPILRKTKRAADSKCCVEDGAAGYNSLANKPSEFRLPVL